jgi:hypothetical protein
MVGQGHRWPDRTSAAVFGTPGTTLRFHLTTGGGRATAAARHSRPQLSMPANAKGKALDACRMNLLAQATLSRSQGRNESIRTVKVVALDVQGHDATARHVVTLQVTQLKAGVVVQVDDSTLTPLPLALEPARQRALAYLRQRLGAGDALQSHDGFAELENAVPAPSSVQALDPAPEHSPLPESALQAAAIPALCRRLDGSAWRLMPSGQQARLLWRLAEYVDTARGGAAQRLLHAQVPRLVALLGTADDLLDYCLAYLIGRLGDGGAAVAMQALSQRGVSEATRDLARQAWLVLLGPEERQAALQAHRDTWAQLAAQQAGQDADADAAFLSAMAPQALLMADELGTHDGEVRERLLGWLAQMPITRASWPVVRRLHKRAEWRRDHGLLAVLHARFDGPRDQRAPFSRDTSLYLRLRGWRQLRRMASADHSESAAHATALLQAMDRRCAAEAASRSGRPPESRWLLAARLLLPRWPQLHASARAHGWHTEAPLDLLQLPAQRVDGLGAMWDAHPERLLQLVGQSRSRLLLWSLTRALRDQQDFLDRLDAAATAPLLHQGYAPAAALGLQIAQQRLVSLADDAARRPWLLALAQCGDGPAASYLGAWLSRDRAAAARDAELAAALLLSPAASSRTLGLALLLHADGAAVALALLAALPALEEDSPALADIRDTVQSLFDPQGPLAAQAAGVPAPPLHHLLAHSVTALVEMATSWLLAHPPGLQTLPPATLRGLLTSDEPARMACGIRLMASLSDGLLCEQADMLAEFAVSPHAALRKAAAPLVARLAGDARCNARIAERLHEVLFRAEKAEGVHDEALRLLTGPLAAVAPARDASGLWRALQAQATGAQRYGAWGLAALDPAAYSLRQWATLARHADADVRARSRQSIDARLTPMEQTRPEQAEQLLPLANALFADTQQYAREMFGERLPAGALTPELLIGWVDHPQPWVQALGRQRLAQHMRAPDASLCLTRLAQHPATSVQLFVTQWLLTLPDEPAPQRAARLQELQPYFLAVLSQVHRARASKTSVLHFLRGQVQAPETAAVVAAIFARQVVSASQADQPDYVAGLRDIAQRHPQLAQSFMQPLAAERRGLATSST